MLGPGSARPRSSAGRRVRPTVSTTTSSGAQVQPCVAGIGIRPEHERAVGLRSRGVRRRGTITSPAQRELRDRPRRQRHGTRRSALRICVIDDPPFAGPAHLDRLGQARAVGGSFDPHAVVHLGRRRRDDRPARTSRRNLGRRPEPMAAEQPVRGTVRPVDRRSRQDRQAGCRRHRTVRAPEDRSSW